MAPRNSMERSLALLTIVDSALNPHRNTPHIYLRGRHTWSWCGIFDEFIKMIKTQQNRTRATQWRRQQFLAEMFSEWGCSLTPLEPQSRLGTKLLEIWLVCTQNGTTVLKGLNPINVVGFSFSCCAIFRSMPIHFPPKTVILGGVYSSLRLCEEPQKEKVESALRRMRRPFSP